MYSVITSIYDFFLSAEKIPSRLICFLLDLISPSHIFNVMLYTRLPEPLLPTDVSMLFGRVLPKFDLSK